MQSNIWTFGAGIGGGVGILGMLKARLDKTWIKLIQWKVSLPWQKP